MEAPSINVSRIRLQDSTVLEQRFLAVLRVQNPNAVDLAIEGISYDLEVNGQPFAKGVGKGLVIIPAFSQGTIETEAITTLTGLVRQLREVARARRPPIAYRLTGKVKLRDHPSALAFRDARRQSLEHQGERHAAARADDPGALSNPSTREATAGSGGGAASSDGAPPWSCLASVVAWVAAARPWYLPHQRPHRDPRPRGLSPGDRRREVCRSAT